MEKDKKQKCPFYNIRCEQCSCILCGVYTPSNKKDNNKKNKKK